jgi:peptidoglycan/LPS O-acetylase OafA/YrhL
MATAVLNPTEILANRRIPSLDGWRGVAILLVLSDHVQMALLGHPMRQWALTGQHGVTIFFVLSGYLITSKLLEGPINLKTFYLRRFFRLMPVAWAYLATLWLFDALMRMHDMSVREATSCLLFYRNFLIGHIATLHFWSLSIEEEFYLTWPVLLLLLGPRRNRWIALAGMFAVAGWRVRDCSRSSEEEAEEGEMDHL